MKSATITGFLGTVIVAGFSLGAFAETKDNPYQVIIDRNPFGLRPIPVVEPPKPPEAPPPPPLEIKLTGITTLLGAPRALLEFTDPQTKKVDRPSPFVEGDVYKETIQIVSIDADNNRVKIKNGEAETTLDFEKNGIKPGGATASAAPVPHPGVAPLNLGNPGIGIPAPPNAAAAAAQNMTGGGRTAIVGGGASAVTPAAVNPAAYAGSAGTTAAGLPARPVRTDLGAAIVGGNQPPQPAAYVPPPATTMSREEIDARIEAQRRILEQQGHPQSRILPPTTLGRQLGTPPAPTPR
jgi:hypothetical protein